jgi:hypothetical protein
MFRLKKRITDKSEFDRLMRLLGHWGNNPGDMGLAAGDHLLSAPYLRLEHFGWEKEDWGWDAQMAVTHLARGHPRLVDFAGDVEWNKVLEGWEKE